MTPKLEIRQTDMRKFQEDFRRVAAASSRPLDLVVNSTMWGIADEAKRRTPLADRAKIQFDLGATLQSERVNKKGKTVRRYKYNPTPVAYAIVNWRRRKAGQPPIPRGEMAAAAKKLIVGRLRAVGSLRAGWSRALGILAASFHWSVDRSGPRIKQASTATPAKPGWKPEARLEYRLVIQNGGKQIDPRVATALDGGFQKKGREFVTKLESELKKSLRQAGAL